MTTIVFNKSPLSAQCVSLERPMCCFGRNCCWLKLFFLVAPGSSYLPSVERSALPYDSSDRGPRKFAICGESGGIERFQLAKRVLCASIAERERESCLCCFLINNSCCFRCSVNAYIVPFFFYPLSIFVLGCQCASRILPTQTKNTLELTTIDNSIDNNCL